MTTTKTTDDVRHGMNCALTANRDDLGCTCGAERYALARAGQQADDHVQKLEAVVHASITDLDRIHEALGVDRDVLDADKVLSAIATLRAQLASAHKEIIEQCRLNGMGAEREAKLMAQLASAQKDAERYRALREGNDYAKDGAPMVLLYEKGYDDGLRPYWVISGEVLDSATDAARAQIANTTGN